MRERRQNKKRPEGYKRYGQEEKDLELMTEEERDQYFAELREKRKQRKLRQKRNARRKKIAVLGATAVVSLVVVVGAVNGITQFVLTKNFRKRSFKGSEKGRKRDGEPTGFCADRRSGRSTAKGCPVRL